MNTKDHLFTITETQGISRSGAPVEIGLPLPAGRYYAQDRLAFLTQHNTPLPAYYAVTALWPDNSIKWVFIRSLVTIEGRQHLNITIRKSAIDQNSHISNSQHVIESSRELIVPTKNKRFHFNKKSFNFIDKITDLKGKEILHGHVSFQDAKNEIFKSEITSYDYKTFYTDKGLLCCTLVLTGCFYDSSQEAEVNFKAGFTFYYDSDSIKCNFSIHNPKAAVHQAGLWDLGDPNSFFFKHLEVALKGNSTAHVSWKAKLDENWETAKERSIHIYQGASGGKNWNSPNHKDHTNCIPLKQNGYTVTNNENPVQSGDRSNPLFRSGEGDNQFHVYLNNFWQDFPKSIGANDGGIKFGLFPHEFPAHHELQPGEQKEHTLCISFEKNNDNPLSWAYHPLQVCLNPDWVTACDIFPFHEIDQPLEWLNKVIQQGLSGESNFFQKRETVDEYGWRNFGDLYADHETDNYDGREIFVSHYNNQYDPVFGFLKQYLMTGDYRWFTLANDLAHHVVDIDIYHTDQDKTEYNHGLFWHTDHYLDAETSSHRSYSRHQKSNAYEGHSGGGGPGGQHCYTTGLLFHYLLTGDTKSKQALYELNEWITHVYEKSDTITNVLIALKNNSRPDLKDILAAQYPLDRGTANYINALLDEYYLSHQHSTLAQIEKIIRNTVHPFDNIHDRQLENIEEKWFYIVFLQALCRYLRVKQEMQALDDDFYYARDSLLHYADWMVEHEYIYLEKPDILEFPNHTWTAQDLRKVNVLFYADYFSAEDHSRYRQKANQLLKEIERLLADEPSNSYTRILALLMQNSSPVRQLDNTKLAQPFSPVRTYPRPVDKGTPGKLLNLTRAFLAALRNTSFSKEVRCLSSQSRLLAKILSPLQ